MRRLLATAATVTLAGSLILLVVHSTPGGVSASGKAPSASVVTQARANFIKVKSAHAPAVGRGGWVSPGGMQHSASSGASGGVTSTQSVNWSGYADTETTSNTVSQVSGNWTIPAVQCLPAPYENQDAFLANWVGLDGYVWYEMYPSATVEEGTAACINDNVDCPQPGDQISASVTVTSAGSGENNYQLTLTDHTTPDESFSVTQQCATTTCLDASAEWIVERPAAQPPPPATVQILPMAYFGTTSFSSADVTSGGVRSDIQGFQDGLVYDISMIDDTASYYLACVGQLAPPGTLLPLIEPSACPAVEPLASGAFQESWDSSY
jgi:hypothetical protein